jgi:hypothetical protein
MSFKQIRTYLTDRLLEVDSDFEVFDEAFDTNNVGTNDFDKRFHIFYGSVVTTASNQNTTQDNVTATVTLNFSGSRNSTEQLDDAMDLALQYRINCLRRPKYVGQTFIKNVVCQNIDATPLDTNDNAIQIRLTFNISIIYGTGITLDCE